MKSSEQNDSIIFQAFSAASICGCVFVISTYLIFSHFRKFRHIEIVFYIAINELVASSGTVLGFNKNGDPACWYQGFTSNLNFLSAAFWNTVISYQLLCIIYGGTRIKDMTWIHVVCWGFPLAVSMAPFSTNTYGNPDSSPGWCFIGNRRGSPNWGIEVWDVLSFYAWLWLAIVSILVMYVLVFRKVYAFKKIDAATWNNMIKFSAYPLVLIFVWTSNTIRNISTEDENNSKGLFQILPGLQGFLNTLAFFFTNRRVRHEWTALLFGKAEVTGIKEKFLNTTSSVEMGGGKSNDWGLTVPLDSEPGQRQSSSGNARSLVSEATEDFYDLDDDEYYGRISSA